MINDFDFSKHFQDYRLQLYDSLASIDQVELQKAFQLLQRLGMDAGRVFVCGNGGSASIAEHFSCDHAKGVREGTFLHPEVISLSSNMALFSAVANDMGYEHVFSEQLYINNITRNDVVVLISSSGKSPNIFNAFVTATTMQSHTISMLGFDGGTVKDYYKRYHTDRDIMLHVKSDNYGICEDSHQILMHSLAQAIRKNNPAQ